MRRTTIGQQKKERRQWQHHQGLDAQTFQRAQRGGFADQTIQAESDGQYQAYPGQFTGAECEPGNAAAGERNRYPLYGLQSLAQQYAKEHIK